MILVHKKSLMLRFPPIKTKFLTGYTKTKWLIYGCKHLVFANATRRPKLNKNMLLTER
ncbi:hypothetical protein HanRHA438_Chr06g0259971 [Helianthus annuus]|nr:hypothetical protein HanRHA438_Chr06g0259971 [Helianthus annuus]